MTSDRPYRKGTTFANAIAEITRCGGTQFDPEMVRAFLDIGEAGLRKIRDDMIARKSAAVDDGGSRFSTLPTLTRSSEVVQRETV